MNEGNLTSPHCKSPILSYTSFILSHLGYSGMYLAVYGQYYNNRGIYLHSSVNVLNSLQTLSTLGECKHSCTDEKCLFSGEIILRSQLIIRPYFT